MFRLAISGGIVPVNPLFDKSNVVVFFTEYFRHDIGVEGILHTRRFALCGDACQDNLTFCTEWMRPTATVNKNALPGICRLKSLTL